MADKTSSKSKISARGDSHAMAIASAEEVRLLAGPVTDHTVKAILEIAPSAEDLEVAVVWARGEGDRVDRLGHRLSGTPARIFKILAEDELYLEGET